MMASWKFQFWKRGAILQPMVGETRAAAEARRGVEDHLLAGVGFGETHVKIDPVIAA